MQTFHQKVLFKKCINCFPWLYLPVPYPTLMHWFVGKGLDDGHSYIATLVLVVDFVCFLVIQS